LTGEGFVAVISHPEFFSPTTSPKNSYRGADEK
jgi:TRAP-type uncharacterized transport system substrate-binding protein